MTKDMSARVAEIDAYLEQHAERFETWLSELVSEPGVSATGKGLADCAERLASFAREAGLAVQVLPTAGAPLVFGQYGDDPDCPTLLVTTHYDVQPEGEAATWDTPPYVLTSRGDRLYGRGSSDAKGPVIAVLAAIAAARHAGALQGINLKVLFDGEEEIGSPSLPAAVEQYRDLFAADAVVTFDGNSLPDGRSLVNFGGGGILYLDMAVRTARCDIHANRGALVPNAAWRLIWALASLKDSSEHVRIAGFADSIASISDADRALLASHHWDDAAELESLGATGYLPRGDHTGPEALHLLPILGVAGFHAGQTDAGVSAVLPAQATAKLYVGLRHAQSPDEIAAKIRDHLDAAGFSDVAISIEASTEPSGHNTASALGRLVIGEISDFYGVAPAIYPRANWYGRQASWLGARLGAHACQVAMVAPPQPNNHGPNEYIERDYFRRGMAVIARIITQAHALPRRSDAHYGPLGPQAKDA